MKFLTLIPLRTVLRFAEWVFGVSFIRLKAVTLLYCSTFSMTYVDF
jgi:hypothetical protein